MLIQAPCFCKNGLHTNPGGINPIGFKSGNVLILQFDTVTQKQALSLLMGGQGVLHDLGCQRCFSSSAREDGQNTLISSREFCFDLIVKILLVRPECQHRASPLLGKKRAQTGIPLVSALLERQFICDVLCRYRLRCRLAIRF